MTVTFQVQLESDNKFTEEELDAMRGMLNIFCSTLEIFKAYIRSAMYENENLSKRY